MTPEQQAKFDAIVAEVSTGVNVAATIAAGVAPEYAPLVYLGAGVAKQFPGLVEDAINLFDKQEPTDADEAALAANIALLQHPEAL